MAFELGQLRQIFFEETAGYLREIDQALSSGRSLSGERLAGCFRAAHSIKGSAATFGFDDVASVAAALERRLDGPRLEGSSVQLDQAPELADAARLLAEQLAAHGREEAIDAARVRVMLSRLEGGSRPGEGRVQTPSQGTPAGAGEFFELFDEPCPVASAQGATASPGQLRGARFAAPPAAVAGQYPPPLLGAHLVCQVGDSLLALPASVVDGCYPATRVDPLGGLPSTCPGLLHDDGTYSLVFSLAAVLGLVVDVTSAGAVIRLRNRAHALRVDAVHDVSLLSGLSGRVVDPWCAGRADCPTGRVCRIDDNWLQTQLAALMARLPLRLCRLFGDEDA